MMRGEVLVCAVSSFLEDWTLVQRDWAPGPRVAIHPTSYSTLGISQGCCQSGGSSTKSLRRSSRTHSMPLPATIALAAPFMILHL